MLSIFGAKDDPFATLDGLQQWSQYSAHGECRHTLFKGGHFYFQLEQERFFSELTQALTAGLINMN